MGLEKNFFNEVKEMILENEKLKKIIWETNARIFHMEKEMRDFNISNKEKFERLKFLEKENADLRDTVRTVGRENDSLKDRLDQALEDADRRLARVNELSKDRAFVQLLKEKLSKYGPNDKTQK